jgi:hypothetical protein
MRISLSLAFVCAISTVALAQDQNHIFGPKPGCTQVKECGQPTTTGEGVKTAADAMDLSGTINDPRGNGLGGSIGSSKSAANSNKSAANDSVGRSHANGRASGLQ